LAIIPQDPVLFSGTIRSNLNPFASTTNNKQERSGTQEDGELWEVLRKVHLRDFVQSLPLCLDAQVTVLT
jgi:ABC-type multidrug transport system fused ATPase/permease subunit